MRSILASSLDAGCASFRLSFRPRTRRSFEFIGDANGPFDDQSSKRNEAIEKDP